MRKNVISIIVPFYKSEKTLEKCVDSILNQTYKDLEVILVNDRGEDKSLDIARSIAKRDSRVVVYDKKHTGVSGSRNYGLARANGEYIQFVDSDDTLDPTMCEKMVKLIQSNNADLAVCNFEHPVFKNFLKDGVYDTSKKDELLQYIQTTFAVVVPWNKLWKHECISTSFDETVKFAEDDLFNIVNLENVKIIASTSEKLYNYFIAPIEECPSSALNSIANQEEFWKTKTSFWYLRALLYKRTYKQVRDFLNKRDSKDVSYAHVFDFMIWEFLLFEQQGTPVKAIKEELKQVFAEKRFIKSLNCRKQYGIEYKYRPKKDNGKLVEEYVDFCYRFFKDKSAEHFEKFYVMLYLFTRMFITRKKTKKGINSADIIARAYQDIIFDTNSEVRYVDKLINGYENGFAI
jgi:glycosyltransferase involved in cell wall biosynthesis